MIDAKELKRLRDDRARLEFIIRMMNAERAYGDWNEFHDTGLPTTQRTATDEEWRAAIDAARSER